MAELVNQPGFDGTLFLYRSRSDSLEQAHQPLDSTCSLT